MGWGHRSQVGEGPRVPEHNALRKRCARARAAAVGRCNGGREEGFWLLFWWAQGAGRWHEFVCALWVLALVALDCFSHSSPESHFCLPRCLTKAGK